MFRILTFTFFGGGGVGGGGGRVRGKMVFLAGIGHYSNYFAHNSVLLNSESFI